MSVLNINEKNFEEEVLKSDKPVIIDFYATWCGPCKMMSPIIDEISKECSDKVKVGKIDTDENASLAEEYGIMSIPTFLAFKNGKMIGTAVGMQDKAEILKMFD